MEAAALRSVLAECRISNAPAPVVVQCWGLDRTHPSAHGDLLAAVVAAGGAIVSLTAPGSPSPNRRALELARRLAVVATAT